MILEVAQKGTLDWLLLVKSDESQLNTLHKLANCYGKFKGPYSQVLNRLVSVTVDNVIKYYENLNNLNFPLELAFYKEDVDIATVEYDVKTARLARKSLEDIKFYELQNIQLNMDKIYKEFQETLNKMGIKILKFKDNSVIESPEEVRRKLFEVYFKQ